MVSSNPTWRLVATVVAAIGALLGSVAAVPPATGAQVPEAEPGPGPGPGSALVVPLADTGSVAIAPGPGGAVAGEAALPAGRSSSPWAATVGPDGMVYVTDAGAASVERVDPDRAVHIDTAIADVEPFRPRGLAFGPEGRLFVVEAGAGRVLGFAVDEAGVVAADPEIESDEGVLVDPVAVVVAADGTLLISDRADDDIERFDPLTGDHLGPLVTLDPGDRPAGMVLTADGRLLVALAGVGVVVAVDPVTGEVGETLIDGLVAPTGLAVDRDGRLWVADWWAGTVTANDPITGQPTGQRLELDGRGGPRLLASLGSLGPGVDAEQVGPVTPPTHDTIEANAAFEAEAFEAEAFEATDKTDRWLDDLDRPTEGVDFVENEGLADDDVDYAVLTDDYDAVVVDGDVALVAEGTEASDAVVMEVLGGAPEPASELLAESPILTDEDPGLGDGGSGPVGADDDAPGPSFDLLEPVDPARADDDDAIEFDDVLPGIDVVYSANGDDVEYSFVVEPGADPDEITLDFDGTIGLRVQPDGDLLIEAEAGPDYRSTAPVTYQEIGGERVIVESAYAVGDDGTVGFTLGAYDPTRPVIIDPTFVAVETAGGSHPTGSTIDLPVPAAVDIDDLMIAQIAYSATGAGIVTPPAGWTSIDTLGGNGITQALYWRLATAGEPAQYSFTLSSGSTDTAAGAITLYDGVDGASPIDVVAGQTNSSGAAVTAPSVVTTVAETELVAFFAVRDDGAAVPPAGMTERTDTNSGSGGAAADEVVAASADEHLTVTGATGSRTATVDATAGSIGHLVALTARPTITVNSTGDAVDATIGDDVCDTGATNSEGDPECTLRAAIAEVNASTLVDAIDFDLPTSDGGHASGVWTIAPGSALPELTASVTVDGSTQPGWSTSPVVVLDGASAGGSTDGVVIAADDVVVRSLAITRFGADGIEVETGAADATIAGNHIGLDASGLVDRGNGGRGIDLQSGSGPTTIGGTGAADRNVISGNGGDGIIVWNSDDNVIIGNYIGTDATGDASGPGIGNGADGIALGLGSSGNTIGQPGAGNVLSGNDHDGVENDATGAGNTVQANMIGLGQDGDTIVANGRHGVVVYDGANNTFVGGAGNGEGNVISGNGQSGVVVDGNNDAATTANVIAGNLIGTDATGSLDRGNGSNGVHLFSGANTNTIGGTTAAHGNVISGNGSGDGGVVITGSASSGNVIRHNTIGVDSAGTSAVPNQLHGLWIESPSTQVLDNLIAGNAVHGIYVYAGDATGTQILRNSIGTNAARSAVIPNGYDGVRLEGGSSGTVVGSAGNGNTIAGNADHGININSSSGNTVQANDIGTNAGGTLDLGNTDAGIYADVFNSSNNLIGGTGAGQGNTIAFNDEGIRLESGTGNAIVGNAIYANAELGVDLDDDGVTANDGGDGDGGTNGLLNFPELTWASADGGTLTVDFDLDAPAGDYRIEFFTNPSGTDPSGNGEGETFVHATTVSHAGSGTESFSTSFAGAAGDALTALTVTDVGGGSHGSSSEFSAAQTATLATVATVNSTGDAVDANIGDDRCDTGASNAEGDPECTLRAAIEEGLVSTIVDSIHFAIPTSDPGYSASPLAYTIAPSSGLPFITSSLTIDATTQPGWAGDPIVELDGSSATGATAGLAIRADDSLISGFIVHSFADEGLEIDGSTGSGDDNVLTSNWVGLDASGTVIGNVDNGILVTDGADGNTIGGTGPNDGNRVAGSGAAGVSIRLTSSGNAVLGNRIWANTGAGLDLEEDGVTANDAGDADAGSNDLLNHPVVTATSGYGTITIDLDLDVPAGDYRIETFSNPSGTDPSGHGEGEVFEAASSITHGGSGSESFQLAYPGGAGDVITLTVTEDQGGGAYGPTSEFSAAFTVVASCGASDSDADGLLDCEEDADTDSDDDPSTTPGPDTDGDTIANYLDADDDDDGTPTASENADPNGDGDPRDALDSDRDGRPDYLDAPTVGTGTTVEAEQKISDTTGDLTATLDDGDFFGHSVTAIGDLDDDGVEDLAVGAIYDDDGGDARGAVHILFMNGDGRVASEQKISDTVGGLTAPLDQYDYFGAGIAALGDLDGDGVEDIAVGAHGDDDGGSQRGAVHVLFLNADGTVRAEQKISDTVGGLGAVLADGDNLGISVTGLGDLDGDGLPDLAVGANADDGGGPNRGAVHILFLNADGTVKAEHEIASSIGGGPGLDDYDQFGVSVTGLGDVDGDGIMDLAVGAYFDDDGGTNRGAVHILFLDTDGTVTASQKISDTQGGFTDPLIDNDHLGRSVAGLGDLDGDGTPDLVSGAMYDDDGGPGRGAVYLMLLDTDGTVRQSAKVSSTAGGLTGPLADDDNFGFGVTGLGDLDGDGSIGVAVGAPKDDDGGSDRGAVHVLDLAVLNSAPVLDDTGTMTLAAIGEDAFATNGETVAGIVASAGGDRITDVDGDPEGILVESASSGDDNGWFEFSTDGGTTWTRFGWYWHGLLLADTDRIRFVPAGFDAETASITFRAWDRSSGIAGTVVRDPATGGSTAFSTATEVATITTTAIGDAPVFGLPAGFGPGGSTDPVVVVDLEDRSERFAAVAEAPDGSVVAAGDIDGDVLMTRLAADGSVDPSFGHQGYVVQAIGTGSDGVDAVAVQPDGRIVVVGRTNSGTDDALVARFDADGSLDATFGGGDGWASVPSSTFHGVAIQPDGRIVAAGASGDDLLATRFDPDGTADPTFGSGGTIVHAGIDAAADLALQADGKLVVATEVDGAAVLAAARLTTNGAIDTTFGGGDGVADTDLGLTSSAAGGLGVAVQSDGAIVVTGTVWYDDPGAWEDDLALVATARFDPSGALDTTFGSGLGHVADIVPGGSYLGAMEAVAIQPDGNLVAAGSFDLGYKGQTDVVVARRLTDGTIDTGFDGEGFALTATGRLGNQLHDVIVASDGDIVVVGSVDGEDGLVIRYDSAGSPIAVPGAHGLDATPTYASGGAAATMDLDVAIHDRELTDATSWNGTSLRFDRQGGADPTDEFVATGDLATLTEGGSLVLDGTTIGTVTTNSGGTLVLDFTIDANEARVGETMESLAYRNPSSPPGVVTMAWTFDDGTGATAVGTVPITIVDLRFDVNSTGDGVDATPGDGLCDTGGINADGDPECTLRAAIEEVNGTAGDEVVVGFAIPTSDPGFSTGPTAFTLTPATPYPVVAERITIDGATQAQYSTLPVIVIDGSAAGAGADGLELGPGSDASTINGLTIHSFAQIAIAIDSSDAHTITGNLLGLDADGTTARGNRYGLYADTSVGLTIGGTTAADRNVIADNDWGIALYEDSTDAVIVGNYVGTDATGLLDRGQRWDGIFVVNSSSRARIGGPTTAEANVVAGNGGDGIYVGSGTMADVVIEGNLVGIGADGTTPIANDDAGVNLGWGQATRVIDNVIGPGLHGIALAYHDSATIAGNSIGTDPTGTEVWPLTGAVVLIDTASDDTTIGGVDPADANVIRNGGAGGVVSTTAAGTGNAIVGNSIVANAGPGIDLGDDGVTANDVGDGDTGPNDLLNRPALSRSVESGPGSLTTTLELDAPAGTYRIELFGAQVGGGVDDSGAGEGEVLLGAGSIVHTGSGSETFTIVHPGSAGDLISATATVDLGGGDLGSTSEFSRARTALAPGQVAVNDGGDASDLVAGDGSCDTGGLNGEGEAACTLRAALEEIGGAGGVDAVRFDLPASDPGHTAGVWTITPAAGLPPISAAATVDGTTQPGWSTTPVVELDGGSAGPVDGLTIASPGVVVRGLSVGNFTGHGIVVWPASTGGTTIAGNHIGLDASGLVARSNLGHGIDLRAGSGPTTVGGPVVGDGNVIAGNGDDGIHITSSDVNVVSGNLVGTDATGSTTLGNGGDGVDVSGGATATIIGGSTSAHGNVVAGSGTSAGHGVRIEGATTSGTVVRSNRIGTTSAGDAAAANAGSGIVVDGAPDTDVVDNLIAGNGGDGLHITGATATGVEVTGNTIGLDLAGTATLGNGGDGIQVDGGAAGTIIGVAGGGNAIGGNAGHGVRLDGAVGTIVSANHIGTDVGASLDLGNTGAGIAIAGAPSTATTIGGTGVGDGNVITDNATGVVVGAGTGNGHHILGNQIVANTALGIDLSGDGPTVNDAGDVDIGANDLLNHPVIDNVQRVAGDLVVDLTIDVAAGDHRIELFGNTSADPGGNDEGEIPLGGATVTHTGSGPERFTLTVPSAPTIVTATTTEDLGGGTHGSTSEFSVGVPSPDLVVVNSTGDGTDALVGDGRCDTGATNTAGDPECTLRAAIVEANDATTPVDTIWFSIPATDPGHAAGVWTIAPGSPLPAVTDTATITGAGQSGWTANSAGAPAGLNGTQVVVIDGSSAGSASGLVLDGDAVAVRALVVGGFADHGIELNGTGVSVAGAHVGIDAAGTAANPNGGDGLHITGAGAVIGGAVAADRVLVAGNGGHGIEVAGVGGTGATIVGSIVGSDVTGAIALANLGAGVLVDAATGVRVGGTGAGEGNVVAGNGGDGVAVIGAGAAVTVVGNSMSGNGGEAIDLGADGVTANDAGDGDSGPNDLLNSPVLGTASVSAGIVTVDYTLDVPPGTYRVELFANPDGADPSGHGEAGTPLGAATVIHPGGGPLARSTEVASPAGTVITAIATVDLGGGSHGVSSEASNAVTSTDRAGLTIVDHAIRRSDTVAAGSLDPSAAATAGVAGSALAFDGSDDRLVGPGLDVTGGALTVGAWVRPDALTGVDRIVSKRTGAGSAVYELSVDGGTGEALATIGIGGGTTVRGGSIGIGAWHQLLATWDGTDLVLFVDGVEVDRTAAVGTLATDTDTPLVIGNGVGATSGFDGRIDQVTIVHQRHLADRVVADRTAVVDGSSLISVGAQQAGTSGSWTVSSDRARSGSSALLAPETPAGAGAAWAVARGLDEVGLTFRSWWWLSSATGVDLAAGTRAGPVATDELEAALVSPSGWELRRRSGPTETVDAGAAGTPATGAWVEVEIQTDQDGNSRLLIGGVEVHGWTAQGSDPTSGSVGLRAGLLPTGERWYVDDPRARRLVTPEPVATLGPLDRQ